MDAVFARAGWSIGKLAAALALSHEAVRLWFRGERKISPRRCVEIERLTGIPRHELRPDIYPPPNDREVA